MLDKFTISVFNGSWNAPIWSAVDQGYFYKNGLDVSVNYTDSSTSLINGFYSGDYPLVFCSADNVLAYQENRAEVNVEGTPDAAIFLTGDSGFLYPVTSIDIKNISALRGKTIGVDKKDTGFAYVLYDIMKKNGVEIEEVSIKEMGSTEKRLGMIANGECQATLLRTPYQQIAQQQGLNVFNEYRLDLTSYVGTVGVVRRSWFNKNAHVLNAFKDAYRDGLNWFFTNPFAAMALLMKHLPQIESGLVKHVYEELRDERFGLNRSLLPNMGALREVLRLRAAYQHKLTGSNTHRIDIENLIL